MSTAPPRRNQHVYIVDDDQPVTTALVRGLEQAGFDVHTFGSADAFLQKAILFRPAALVLDMQMPGTNGVQLQALLKERGWHTPIIFISGQSTVQQGITAMKQGAFDFLVKPFDLDRLIELLERAIEEDARLVLSDSAQAHCRRLLEQLRPREYQAYLCLARGHSYAEMMAELQISMPTAKQYRAAVMRKLKLATLAELIEFHKTLRSDLP